jgi:hypothetical protein
LKSPSPIGWQAGPPCATGVGVARFRGPPPMQAWVVVRGIAFEVSIRGAWRDGKGYGAASTERTTPSVGD